jgi:acetyl-CoA carboxylase, biotin carboxylase subunit
VPVFDRVLVANRGEIAVRVIRAAHELGIEAVAVYSTVDRDAVHVRLADQAVCIGPPAAAESYLRISNVVAAAETTGCDAVHPGYGFLAENAEFVHACVDNNLVFIGPTADVVERMGDKVRAKEAMRDAGVPLVPGSDGEIGPEALRRAAAAAGFPVLLKAAAGGGGKGMRLVSSEDELDEAFAGASAEAEAAFGDGEIYVEKLVAPARHVEIQVLCDDAGGVLTLGERECSIQRRHQKLIEESPSLALDSETREAMESTVASACKALGYRNAGTFEFLVGPDGAFYFIEVNCRLQVEHPVSELVTGIDIVREQIRIASGEALAVTGRASRSGHAIEIRINAEDPARGFLPAPGTVTRFVPPLGPGVRVDTAVESGTEIVPYYDSMIAKVVVSDDTRDAAIGRAERALGELVIEGIPTTRELALDILASTAFREGDYSTSTLIDLEGTLPSLRAT